MLGREEERAVSIIVITGGVRSGKSKFAEEVAQQIVMELRSKEEMAKTPGSVLYVATGKAWDSEMTQRIRIHQERRPADWGLLEVSNLLEEVFSASADYQVVLVDCLSNWVSNRLIQIPEEKMYDQEIQKQLLLSVQQWAQAMNEDKRTYIVVTSEVGLGGVALSSLGRWFADLLGEANQIVARQAETVHLVLSGIPWRIKG